MRLKSLTAGLLALLMLMSGCSGKTEAASVTILTDGEQTDSVTVNTSSEVILTAQIEPEGAEGEISWSSSDAGIIRPVTQEDGTVKLTILKTGTAKITASIGDVSATVKFVVEKDQDALLDRDIAVTINGRAFSEERLQLAYALTYYNVLDSIGSYASYYGLDSSTGPFGLGEQECTYSEYDTWRDYFLGYAVYSLQEIEALCAYADENGIVLDEDDLASVEEELAALEEEAAEVGMSADEYLAASFGSGITEDIYRSHIMRDTLAEKAYNAYKDTLSFTDEELETWCAENGYDSDDYHYQLVSMRHILIMAEADDDGNYTDEAIAAAHSRAEEIYADWLAGDADEDSFAALAEEYSEDPGSNTNGGLYENIYKDEMVEGINSWLFAKRSAGDTAVIDNNGSYTGTHIVYFTGTGEYYDSYLAESALNEDALTEWLDGLYEDCTVEYGPAYANVDP